MPPNQQPGQYDFILNNNPKPPRQPMGMAGRILVVVGGAVILIIAAILLFNFLGSGSKEQQQRLVDLGKAQSEIIRVSTLAEKDLQLSDTKRFAANVRVATTTDQAVVKGMLTKNGVKAKQQTKLLAAGKNTKTDAALLEAKNNSRYDETFLALMQQQLIDYNKLLVAASEGVPKDQKELLVRAQNNIKLLIPEDAQKNSGSIEPLAPGTEEPAN